MYLVISSLVKTPGRSLAGRFSSLGTLKGKTKEEIISVVGRPNSVSAMPNGSQLLQWMATGYHISLMFDSNENCLGVSHEFSQVSSPITASEQLSRPTSKSVIASMNQSASGKNFCIECGQELELGSKFCNYCGTKQH